MEAIGRSLRLERPFGSARSTNAPSGTKQAEWGATGPTFNGALEGAHRARMEGGRISSRHGSHRDANNEVGSDTRAGADRRAEHQRIEERGWDRHEERRRSAESRLEEAGKAERSISGSQGLQGPGSGENAEPPYASQAAWAAPTSVTALASTSPLTQGKPSVVPTTGNSVGADIGTSPKAALVTPLSTSLGTPRPAGGANASNAQGLASVSATSGKQGVGKTTVDPSQATSEVNDTEATRRAERGAEVLRQIRLNLTGAAREVSIQLRPAELGRIQIRLGVRGGEASAEVTVERQETLDLLRGHLPELRAALAERGLDSGEINLGLWDGNGEWGEREDNAGQRPVMAGSLTALAETTNEAWMDWLDPDVGVDLYA